MDLGGASKSANSLKFAAAVALAGAVVAGGLLVRWTSTPWRSIQQAFTSGAGTVTPRDGTYEGLRYVPDPGVWSADVDLPTAADGAQALQSLRARLPQGTDLICENVTGSGGQQLVHCRILSAAFPFGNVDRGSVTLSGSTLHVNLRQKSVFVGFGANG